MSKYNNLSESELKAVIDQAEQVLKERQGKKRKEVIAEINALAASIGVTVYIKEEVEKTVKKVAPKYRNPDNTVEMWSGRGIPPKWMQALISAGHEKSEFLI